MDTTEGKETEKAEKKVGQKKVMVPRVTQDLSKIRVEPKFTGEDVKPLTATSTDGEVVDEEMEESGDEEQEMEDEEDEKDGGEEMEGDGDAGSGGEEDKEEEEMEENDAESGSGADEDEDNELENDDNEDDDESDGEFEEIFGLDKTGGGDSNKSANDGSKISPKAKKAKQIGKVNVAEVKSKTKMVQNTVQNRSKQENVKVANKQLNSNKQKHGLVVKPQMSKSKKQKKKKKPQMSVVPAVPRSQRTKSAFAMATQAKTVLNTSKSDTVESTKQKKGENNISENIAKKSKQAGDKKGGQKAATEKVKASPQENSKQQAKPAAKNKYVEIVTSPTTVAKGNLLSDIIKYAETGTKGNGGQKGKLAKYGKKKQLPAVQPTTPKGPVSYSIKENSNVVCVEVSPAATRDAGKDGAKQAKSRKRKAEWDEDYSLQQPKMTAKQRRKVERESRDQKTGTHFYSAVNVKNRNRDKKRR